MSNADIANKVPLAATVYPADMLPVLANGLYREAARHESATLPDTIDLDSPLKYQWMFHACLRAAVNAGWISEGESKNISWTSGDSLGVFCRKLREARSSP